MSLTDVLGIAGLVVTIIGGIAGFLFRLYILKSREVKSLRRDLARGSSPEVSRITKLLKEATDRGNELQGKLDTAVADLHKANTQAKETSDQANVLKERRLKDQERIDALEANILRLKDEAEQARAELKEANVNLEIANKEISDQQRKDSARGNQVKRVFKLEGRLWEQRHLRGIPRFRSLSDRQTPVVSVLNLKGGVGKTTITAHLGAVLSNLGYRVLLVDLDLQGSLSSLFVDQLELANRRENTLLLQNYLKEAAEGKKTNLLTYTVPIMNRSAIIATTDQLAYAELNLTMNWLFRIGKKDHRFLLRKGLHQKRVTNNFDIVLLDCPPLINTCCVNALAASDYVLIPVVPSRKATERVPQLIAELRRLCEVVNPDLQIAGIVANRTRGAQMTSRETDLWSSLQVQCKDKNESPIHVFKTLIRQNVAIGENEQSFESPVEGSELYSTFRDLAQELLGRMPSDCCRSASDA